MKPLTEELLAKMVQVTNEHRCVICNDVDFFGDEFDLGPDAPNDWLCGKCQSDPYRVV